MKGWDVPYWDVRFSTLTSASSSATSFTVVTSLCPVVELQMTFRLGLKSLTVGDGVGHVVRAPCSALCAGFLWVPWALGIIILMVLHNSLLCGVSIIKCFLLLWGGDFGFQGPSQYPLSYSLTLITFFLRLRNGFISIPHGMHWLVCVL